MTAGPMLKKPRTVIISLRDREAFPFMDGMCLGVPGTIVEDEASGIRVRILEDGSLEQLLPGGHPRAGVASDASAGRAS